MQAIRIAATSIALLAVGCVDGPELFNPHLPATQQEAGAIHVSRKSIATWDSYVAMLQPNFTLTADGAFQAALPKTQYTQSSVVDSFNLGIQVGLSSRTTTSSQTTTTTDDETSTSSSTAKNTNPPTLSSSTPQFGAAPDVTKLPPATGTLAADPIRQYNAATAIFQEVQLLNSYVKDAALQRDAVPYAVRIAVGVEPFARGQPFDVYVDASAFAQCGLSDDSGIIGAEPASVVPLLVTDDLETGQATNTVEFARQLAASLGGIADNVALQAQVQKLRAELSSVLGNSYNSLFTVTRGGSDNVVHMRIGAAFDPNSRFAMIPETRNVTLIVLVPKKFVWDSAKTCEGKAARINIITTSTFRNAMTGAPLPFDWEAIDKTLETTLGRFLPAECITQWMTRAPPDDLAPIDDLLANVGDNQYPQFVSNLSSKMLSPPVRNSGQDRSVPLTCAIPKVAAQALWAALSPIVVSSDFASTSFDLPQPARPPGVAGAVKESVVLRASGEDAVVRLSGWPGVAANTLQARLVCNPGLIILPSNGISRSDAEGPITLQFADFKSFNKQCTAAVAEAAAAAAKQRKKGQPQPAAPKKEIKLQVDWQATNARWSSTATPETYEFASVIEGSATSSKIDYSFVASAEALSAETGGTQIRVFLGGVGTGDGADIASVTISVAGASIEQAGGVANGTIKVMPAKSDAPIAIDMKLTGLVPGRIVTITAAPTGKNKIKVPSKSLHLPIVAVASGGSQQRQ